jgi:glycosyltransferase involved in cell wall biosynthesis
MKILHVIPSISPARGGPSQAVISMVKFLRLAGVEAEIITTNDNGSGLLDVPLYNLYEYEGVPVRFFPRFSPPLLKLRKYILSPELTLWLWQNMDNYDLLHIHYIFSYVSTTTMAIARFCRVPYITRPLGQLCEWSLQQSRYKKELYLKLIERQNLNHCRALHFTSIQEKNEFLPLGWEIPSFVLPHGHEPHPNFPDARLHLRQQLGIGDNCPVVLFLSRLHPKKGLENTIAALSKCQEAFTFIIAGSGEDAYTAHLRCWVHEMGLTDRTIFAGFVSGEQKCLLLQGADLFILTSYSENFGLAVLEAMASGIPVLLTPEVALASVVRDSDCGYVTKDNSIPSIVENLQKFFCDRLHAKQMGKNGSKLVNSHYTWAATTSKLFEIYSNLLAGLPAQDREQ